MAYLPYQPAEVPAPAWLVDRVRLICEASDVAAETYALLRRSGLSVDDSCRRVVEGWPGLYR